MPTNSQSQAKPSQAKPSHRATTARSTWGSALRRLRGVVSIRLTRTAIAAPTSIRTRSPSASRISTSMRKRGPLGPLAGPCGLCRRKPSAAALSQTFTLWHRIAPAENEQEWMLPPCDLRENKVAAPSSLHIDNKIWRRYIKLYVCEKCRLRGPGWFWRICPLA